EALRLLYGDSFISKVLGYPLMHVLAKIPLFSALYGAWQKQPWTKRKIEPFIKAFDIDTSEFLEPVENFRSFNDFFIRKLKPETRPVAKGDDLAVIPADGRYYFFQDIDKTEGFIVKGEKFDLSKLLEDATLADSYAHGSMVMARLCPTDYHR